MTFPSVTAQSSNKTQSSVTKAGRVAISQRCEGMDRND
jgi:hypothetical protein